MSMHSIFLPISFMVALGWAGVVPAAPDGHELRGESISSTAISSSGQILPRMDARWEKVPGCARAIAAGGVDQVLIVGCGGQYAADTILEWQGGRFVAEPEGSVMVAMLPDGQHFKEGSRVPARASGLAIDAVAGKVFALGPDATVYSRPWASPNYPPYHHWTQHVGAPRYMPPARMTAIAAGGGRSGGNLWSISAQPGGPGGNKIYTSEPCPSLDRIGSGRCWKGVNGAAQRIALGDEVWVVSADGGIFQRQGSQWQRMPGCARDIAANGSHVYVVGCEGSRGEGNDIFRWKNGQWHPIRRTGKTLAVDVAGNLWIVMATGDIWRQRPVTPAPLR